MMHLFLQFTGPPTFWYHKMQIRRNIQRFVKEQLKQKKKTQKLRFKKEP